MKAFRSEAERDARYAEADKWHAEFGLNHVKLDRAAFSRGRTPRHRPRSSAACTGTDRSRSAIPGALGLAYLRRFEALGGAFPARRRHDAEGARRGRLEAVAFDGTIVSAHDALICLGPWADLVTRNLGYRLPLAVKRGYHMHYQPQGNAVLNHPVLDHERGYFLAPMRQGRAAHHPGAEFAARDAGKTRVQLGRAEPIARTFFPLASGSTPNPGWARAPARPTCCRSSGRRRATSA